MVLKMGNKDCRGGMKSDLTRCCFFGSKPWATGLLSLTTTETDSGLTHTKVLGDLDEGVGHLRGVGAAGNGGLGHGKDRLALDGLEGSLTETCMDRIVRNL